MCEAAFAPQPVEFEVELTGPLDMAASLELLRSSGDDLIDRWDGTRLARTIRVGDRTVAYACESIGTVEEPAIRVMVGDHSDRLEVGRTIRSTFVAVPPEFGDLLRRDPVISRLNSLFPGLRPVLQFDLFAALVRSISAQQVNLRWAVTTRRRLAEAFGEKHRVGEHVVYALKPERLAAAEVAEIRALQFTTRKAEYIIGVAEEIAHERLSIAELSSLPEEKAVSRLTSLRGIGLWTAEWILARTLGCPRVVAGDLAVRKAIGLAYLGKPLPTEKEVRLATSHWRVASGMAQALVLHGLNADVLITSTN